MSGDPDRTLYVGGFSSKVTEELLYELFLQTGPVQQIRRPKDKNGFPSKYAFIIFKHAESVPYTIKVLEGTKLFGQHLRLSAQAGSSHEMQSSEQGNAKTLHRSVTWHGEESSRYHEPSWNMQSGQPIPFSLQGQRCPLSLSPLAMDRSMQPKKSSRERNNEDDRWIDQPLQNPYANDSQTMFSRRQRVMQQQNLAIDSHRHRNHDRDYQQSSSSRHESNRHDQSNRYNDRRQQSWKSGQKPYNRRH